MRSGGEDASVECGEVVLTLVSIIHVGIHLDSAATFSTLFYNGAPDNIGLIHKRARKIDGCSVASGLAELAVRIVVLGHSRNVTYSLDTLKPLNHECLRRVCDLLHLRNAVIYYLLGILKRLDVCGVVDCFQIVDLGVDLIESGRRIRGRELDRLRLRDRALK